MVEIMGMAGTVRLNGSCIVNGEPAPGIVVRRDLVGLWIVAGVFCSSEYCNGASRLFGGVF